jgi:signal transduction histidine kinase
MYPSCGPTPTTRDSYSVLCIILTSLPWTRRRHSRNMHPFIGIIISLMACLAASISLAGVPLPRSVLVLDQFELASPLGSEIFSGFRSTLNKETTAPLSIYAESLDITRFMGPRFEGALRAYLREKYSDKPIGVIMVNGQKALELALQLRTQLWSDVPVIFAGVDEETDERLKLPPDVTGTTIRLSLHDSVTVARTLVRDLKRVAIVGNPPERQAIRGRHLEQELQLLARELELIDLTRLPMNELKERVASLPNDTAIIYVGLTTDEAGVAYTSREALIAIAEVANRPIVVQVEIHIGYGATGGIVVRPALIGEEAARLALRVLGGESPSKVPVISGDFVRPVFDWRQLQRWKISDDKLPPGSEVRFRELSMLEQYRWQITAIGAALLIQLLLIVFLYVEHRRRRNAEGVARSTLSELAHINRIATAGELSGSIAHEIKQPLAAMVTQANAGLRWLTRAAPDLDEARAAFTKIINSGHNASNVIDSIRMMFKKENPEGARAPVEINELIRQVLILVQDEQLKYEVSTRTQLTRPLPEVTGDRVQLQQVILNLVKNAIEAMGAVTDRERVLRVKTEIDKSGGVLVSIEDTGTGIDPKHIDRIFNSLFTTKSQGMGLGLAICKTIIEAHDGRIWALSDLHYGSIFQFILPTGRPELTSSTSPTDGKFN